MGEEKDGKVWNSQQHSPGPSVAALVPALV